MHYYIFFIENKKGGKNLAISENKKRIMISLTKEQDEELKKLAKKKGFSKSAIVAIALEEYKKGQKNA